MTSPRPDVAAPWPCPECQQLTLFTLETSSEPEGIRKDAGCARCLAVFAVTKAGLVRVPERAVTDVQCLTCGTVQPAAPAVLDKATRSSKPQIGYLLLWQQLREVAVSHGYALAVHGSLSRDLDLIAVPWADHASDPETLLQAILEQGQLHAVPGRSEPTAKPWGRLAYVLFPGGATYVDLSIMPRGQAPAAAGELTPAPSGLWQVADFYVTTCFGVGIPNKSGEGWEFVTGAFRDRKQAWVCAQALNALDAAKPGAAVPFDGRPCNHGGQRHYHLDYIGTGAGTDYWRCADCGDEFGPWFRNGGE